MSKTATFTVAKIATAPLKITLAIPPERPVLKGYITGRAIVRPQTDIKAFSERCKTEEISNEDVLRWQYEGFDGLANADGYCEGEAAFQEILTGENSAYLIPAVSGAYWEHYGEARQGNYKAPRGR